MTPVLIVALVFTFVIIVTRMGMEHEKEKIRLKSGVTTDKSLVMSELRQLIREAVEEANEPLVARVKAIESELDRLNGHALPSPDDPKQLKENTARHEEQERPF